MDIRSSSANQKTISAEDIPVSRAMVDVGLAVLEETGDWPISRSTVERAFQEMYLCGFRESASASFDL